MRFTVGFVMRVGPGSHAPNKIGLVSLHTQSVHIVVPIFASPTSPSWSAEFDAARSYVESAHGIQIWEDSLHARVAAGP